MKKTNKRETGLSQSAVDDCTEEHNTEYKAMSDIKDTYRIKIVPDTEEYMMCDAEDEAEVNAAIERDGVWGFVVEKQVDCTSEEGDCGEPHWEHVDSCYGFIGGDDYILEAAVESIPVGTGTVSVVDERGNEINEVER